MSTPIGVWTQLEPVPTVGEVIRNLVVVQAFLWIERFGCSGKVK